MNKFIKKQQRILIENQQNPLFFCPENADNPCDARVIGQIVARLSENLPKYSLFNQTIKHFM